MTRDTNREPVCTIDVRSVLGIMRGSSLSSIGNKMSPPFASTLSTLLIEFLQFIIPLVGSVRLKFHGLSRYKIKNNVSFFSV